MFGGKKKEAPLIERIAVELEEGVESDIFVEESYWAREKWDVTSRFVNGNGVEFYWLSFRFTMRSGTTTEVKALRMFVRERHIEFFEGDTVIARMLHKHIAGFSWTFVRGQF